ncbi:Mitochondrial distribution and morphology protein 12, variant 2 [Balamuthia mandrillaris]
MAAVPDDEPIKLEGFLLKQGAKGFRKGFKKRWFSLQDNRLYYYVNQGDTIAQSLGFIDIMAASSIIPSGTSRNCEFQINTPGRAYTLVASSDKEMKYWVNALNGYRRKMIRMSRSVADGGEGGQRGSLQLGALQQQIAMQGEVDLLSSAPSVAAPSSAEENNDEGSGTTSPRSAPIGTGAQVPRKREKTGSTIGSFFSRVGESVSSSVTSPALSGRASRSFSLSRGNSGSAAGSVGGREGSIAGSMTNSQDTQFFSSSGGMSEDRALVENMRDELNEKSIQLKELKDSVVGDLNLLAEQQGFALSELNKIQALMEVYKRSFEDYQAAAPTSSSSATLTEEEEAATKKEFEQLSENEKVEKLLQLTRELKLVKSKLNERLADRAEEIRVKVREALERARKEKQQDAGSTSAEALKEELLQAKARIQELEAKAKQTSQSFEEVKQPPNDGENKEEQVISTTPTLEEQQRKQQQQQLHNELAEKEREMEELQNQLKTIAQKREQKQCSIQESIVNDEEDDEDDEDEENEKDDKEREQEEIIREEEKMSETKEAIKGIPEEGGSTKEVRKEVNKNDDIILVNSANQNNGDDDKKEDESDEDEDSDDSDSESESESEEEVENEEDFSDSDDEDEETKEMRKDCLKVQALFDFNARNGNELTFFRGDIIFVYEKDSSGWWKGELEADIRRKKHRRQKERRRQRYLSSLPPEQRELEREKDLQRALKRRRRLERERKWAEELGETDASSFLGGAEREQGVGLFPSNYIKIVPNFGFKLSTKVNSHILALQKSCGFAVGASMKEEEQREKIERKRQREGRRRKVKQLRKERRRLAMQQKGISEERKKKSTKKNKKTIVASTKGSTAIKAVQSALVDQPGFLSRHLSSSFSSFSLEEDTKEEVERRDEKAPEEGKGEECNEGNGSLIHRTRSRPRGPFGRRLPSKQRLAIPQKQQHQSEEKEKEIEQEQEQKKKEEEKLLSEKERRKLEQLKELERIEAEIKKKEELLMLQRKKKEEEANAKEIGRKEELKKLEELEEEKKKKEAKERQKQQELRQLEEEIKQKEDALKQQKEKQRSKEEKERRKREKEAAAEERMKIREEAAKQLALLDETEGQIRKRLLLLEDDIHDLRSTLEDASSSSPLSSPSSSSSVSVSSSSPSSMPTVTTLRKRRIRSTTTLETTPRSPLQEMTKQKDVLAVTRRLEALDHILKQEITKNEQLKQRIEQLENERDLLQWQLDRTNEVVAANKVELEQSNERHALIRLELRSANLELKRRKAERERNKAKTEELEKKLEEAQNTIQRQEERLTDWKNALQRGERGQDEEGKEDGKKGVEGLLEEMECLRDKLREKDKEIEKLNQKNSKAESNESRDEKEGTNAEANKEENSGTNKLVFGEELVQLQRQLIEALMMQSHPQLLLASFPSFSSLSSSPKDSSQTAAEEINRLRAQIAVLQNNKEALVGAISITSSSSSLDLSSKNPSDSSASFPPPPPPQPAPSPSSAMNSLLSQQRWVSGAAPPPLPPLPSQSSSSSSKEAEEEDGAAPMWLPDISAPVCFQCRSSFSVFKRRHHCRFAPSLSFAFLFFSRRISFVLHN